MSPCVLYTDMFKDLQPIPPNSACLHLFVTLFHISACFRVVLHLFVIMWYPWSLASLSLLFLFLCGCYVVVLNLFVFVLHLFVVLLCACVVIFMSLWLLFIIFFHNISWHSLQIETLAGGIRALLGQSHLWLYGVELIVSECLPAHHPYPAPD